MNFTYERSGIQCCPDDKQVIKEAYMYHVHVVMEIRTLHSVQGLTWHQVCEMYMWYYKNTAFSRRRSTTAHIQFRCSGLYQCVYYITCRQGISHI